MNKKNCKEPEQRRRQGQEGEASRAKSQMMFPGSTAFRYPHRVGSELKSQRWRASPAQAALFSGRMNKRGMMDDLFDFLFTVLIGFFVLIFINGVLDRGIQASHSATRTEIAQFREQASAITHLAIQAQRGEVGELEAGELDDKLKQNKVIGGGTIAKCEDYETKVDCESDVLKVRTFKVGISEKCRWKKNKCLLQSR